MACFTKLVLKQHWSQTGDNRIQHERTEGQRWGCDWELLNAGSETFMQMTSDDIS